MNDPLYQACRDYLSAKRCTLWSDFDISGGKGDERFEAAARWLQAQVQGVAQHHGAAPVQPDFSGQLTEDPTGTQHRPYYAGGHPFPGEGRHDPVYAAPKPCFQESPHHQHGDCRGVGMP